MSTPYALLWSMIDFTFSVIVTCLDGGFVMPGEEMEEGGEQEGGGWDVDEELELPPDLVSR